MISAYYYYRKNEYTYHQLYIQGNRVVIVIRDLAKIDIIQFQKNVLLDIRTFSSVDSNISKD